MSKSLVYILFSKVAGAEQSELLQELVEEAKTRFKNLDFININVDESPDFLSKYAIKSIPSAVFAKESDHTALDTLEGFAPDRFIQLCEKHSISLTDRLTALINLQPIMVFIKGTPAQPRCGFTAKLLAILDEMDVEYGYFDILRDEQVRQGLKELSKWPTYPQVYVKGELVGGLDIIEELKESGQLESILAGI